ncbi:hypothetical protein Dimus_025489 [Dionaea muscipula]
MPSALVRGSHSLRYSIARFATATRICFSSRSSSSSASADSIPCYTSDSDTLLAVSTLVHRRSKSRWSTLLSLYPRGFSPHQVCQILLQVRNNPRLALAFFQFTLRRSLSPPTLVSYSTIIHILARARLKSRARSLIKEAIRLFHHHHHDDDPHLLSLERPAIFETLVRTYRVCDSAPFVLDLVVEACLDLNRIEPSIEIARALACRGIPLRVSTCNALIDRVSRRRGCHCGYDLYKEMFGIDGHGVHVNSTTRGAAKLLPNVHTFNVLLLSFYRDGLLLDRVAEELWTEMGRRPRPSSTCKPNVYSYNILMAAYCDEEQVGKAWKLWEDMTADGLKPDIVAYNTLIGGYCKVGKVERAEELYREMVTCGIETTRVTYQHLINGYCRIGDVDSALLVCKDVQRKGFSPDSSTIDAVVEGLCSKGRVAEALKLFDVANASSKILNDDGFGFVARKTSYSHLIKGLCLDGEMKEALNLQARMVGNGFHPDSETYRAFIDAYEKQGKTDVARVLRKEMLKNESGDTLKNSTLPHTTTAENKGNLSSIASKRGRGNTSALLRSEIQQELIFLEVVKDIRSDANHGNPRPKQGNVFFQLPQRFCLVRLPLE